MQILTKITRKAFITTYCKYHSTISLWQLIMLHKNIWNPWQLFDQNVSNTNKYAMVILNSPINIPCTTKFLLDMWNNASLRVTVDGGTNRWLHWLNKNNVINCKDPDMITGDMDSITSKNYEYYQQRDVRIIKTPDQNETDYTKALKELKKYTMDNSIEINSILVLADTSGRLDQIYANINTLFKANVFLPNAKIYNLATDSISWLLETGKHQIYIPQTIRNNKEWCALIPVGSKCLLTTSGLKWNLNNQFLEFGKLVSTSNTYNGEELVCIETDGTILWAMGVESLISEF